MVSTDLIFLGKQLKGDELKQRLDEFALLLKTTYWLVTVHCNQGNWSP